MELQECKLCRERAYCCRGPVPGVGNVNAKVCLLGRNPGLTEDMLRRPFVGNAGGKLNEGCALAGLRRDQCWVDNVSKCMTPKDVSPTTQCQKICSTTWLVYTLKSLKQLKLVIAFGNQALHYFEPLAAVSDLHGTFFTSPTEKVGKEGVLIFATYHPSAALRSSLMDKNFVEDMKKLRRYLCKEAK